MPNKTACSGCSGEDCCCCGVYLESRYETFEPPELDEFELDAQLGDDEPEEDLADPGEMDGDHASGLASAGFGTDEDYGDFGGGWEE